MGASKVSPSLLDMDFPTADFSFAITEIGAAEVFVVDDDAVALELHRRFVERLGCRTRAFSNPARALDEFKSAFPTVLVTDYDMPGMNGLELAQQAQAFDPDLRVILLTGQGDEAVAQGALRLGASDYLTKPADPEELALAVRKAVHARSAEDHHQAMVAWLRQELAHKELAIREVIVSTLSAMVNALDARSPHFRGHSQAVSMQAAAIAEAFGLDVAAVERIRTAGLLHDVGMVAVPDAVVEKPERLTADEFKMVREHCALGAEILEPMEHLGESVRYIREHHERWDGSGYPDRKTRDEISLGGQILGLAEAWIALVEDRAHRPGRTRGESMLLIESREGQWFSEDLTAALRRADIGVM